MHRIRAGEERGIALDRIEQQALVGVQHIGVVHVLIVEIHADFAAVKTGTRMFQAKIDQDALVRLNADDDLVFRGNTCKNGMRRFSEVEDDFRRPGGQALAGAQVKRHTVPAPVVDEHFECKIGFGAGIRGNPRFFPVAGKMLVAEFRGEILAKHQVFPQRRFVKRTETLHDLDGFIAHAAGIDA